VKIVDVRILPEYSHEDFTLGDMVDIIDPDVAPMIKDSSTLVPLRFVAENLGGRVEFDHNNKTAIVLTKDKLIKLPVGQNHATVDGEKSFS
jgi:hypothetical protein